MDPSNSRQQAAAMELSQFLMSALANRQGVHAETAVSAAARMTGMLILRSSGLPIHRLPPGSPVFSEAIDERGKQVLSIVGKTIDSFGMPFDPGKLNYHLAPQHDPLLNLKETEQMLDSGYARILRRNGIAQEESAVTAAIATGILIHEAAGVLDPHTGYVIAVFGMVEGAKTVPYSAAPVAA